MTERQHDMIGIGTSAGGVSALLELLPLLPADLPASVFLVLHRHPTAASALVDVLATRSKLVIREPENGEAIRTGTIYVAPQDQHMTVSDGQIRLDRRPRQHHTRPAIDPLFHSLAVFRERAVGVLLTGTLADGVAGLLAIRQAGGTTVAQDPTEATHPWLPLNAIAAHDVQRILKLREIGPFLVELAMGKATV
jgi:two-component system chemotaxis response regulator CheB